MVENVFQVSLQEKELYEWIRERMRNREIIPSMIFRDAMTEKKKEWESAKNIESSNVLRHQVETMRETISIFTDFISSKNLNDEWVKFRMNFSADKPKKIIDGSKITIEEKEIFEELEKHD